MSTKTFPGREPESLLIFLILSILIHLCVWEALRLFSHPFERTKAAAPVPVELLVPPSPKPLEQKRLDVADAPSAAPDNISPLKKAPTHYGIKNQSVKKETRPEPSIKGAMPSAPPPQATSGQKSLQGGAPASGAASKDDASSKGSAVKREELKPVDEPVREKSGLKEGQAKTQAEEKTAPRAPAPGPGIKAGTPRKPNLFPTDERVAELSKKYEQDAPKGEIGKTLQLNTSELKYAKYLIDMKRKIELYWEYPELAARNGWQGDLRINFRINGDGSVTDISLERSSGLPMLDDAAITALRLASPFPPFPSDFDVKDLNIKGQFIYNIITPRMR